MTDPVATLSARRATTLPMARIRRVVAVGCPHDITQRGNFRRDDFYDDEDRSTYLDLPALGFRVPPCAHNNNAFGSKRQFST